MASFCPFELASVIGDVFLLVFFSSARHLGVVDAVAVDLPGAGGDSGHRRVLGERANSERSPVR